MKVFTVSVLLVLLLLQTGWSQDHQELKYDDGVANLTWTFGTNGRFFTTRFTPPANVLLEKTRFFIADTSKGATFLLSIYLGSNGEPGYPLVDQVPKRADHLGWNEIDLTEYDIQVSQDFYISIEYDLESELAMGAEDQDPISRRSYDSDC